LRGASDPLLVEKSLDRSVVARFAQALRTGEPARMAGEGGQTRDFIHVSDVVRANLAAADGRIEGAFNVGTGVETSIAEVWEIVQEALGMRGHVGRGPARGDDRARNALDGSRLRKVAGLPDPVSVREGVGSRVARTGDC
jgi:UDP-glucose 4-epimerase